MKTFDIRTVVAVATMALMTACGGSAPVDDGATTTAALMVNGNSPVADCEAEGCNRPRIIDDNAEQFRASAALQAQLAEAAQAGASQSAPAQQSGTAGPGA